MTPSSGCVHRQQRVRRDHGHTMRIAWAFQLGLLLGSAILSDPGPACAALPGEIYRCAAIALGDWGPVVEIHNLHEPIETLFEMRQFRFREVVAGKLYHRGGCVYVLYLKDEAPGLRPGLAAFHLESGLDRSARIAPLATVYRLGWQPPSSEPDPELMSDLARIHRETASIRDSRMMDGGFDALKKYIKSYILENIERRSGFVASDVLEELVNTRHWMHPFTPEESKRILARVSKATERQQLVVKVQLALSGSIDVDPVVDAVDRYAARNPRDRLKLTPEGWDIDSLLVDALVKWSTPEVAARRVNHPRFGGHLAMELVAAGRSEGHPYLDRRLRQLRSRLSESARERFHDLKTSTGIRDIPGVHRSSGR